MYEKLLGKMWTLEFNLRRSTTKMVGGWGGVRSTLQDRESVGRCRRAEQQTEIKSDHRCQVARIYVPDTPQTDPAKQKNWSRKLSIMCHFGEQCWGKFGAWLIRKWTEMAAAIFFVMCTEIVSGWPLNSFHRSHHFIFQNVQKVSSRMNFALKALVN